jgi:DNA polymerase Ligase (LigD)
MPRFVILTHDWPFPHYDLMLESGDMLRTWRLSGPPIEGQAVIAEPLGNHRLAYLDYEGPVSGGRGRVERWDWGSLEWRRDDDIIEVRIVGMRLAGVISLVRQPDETWTCCFEKQS